MNIIINQIDRSFTSIQVFKKIRDFETVSIMFNVH